MAKLVFRVAADYDEVIKLRNEIAKLKSELKGMDASATPHAFNTLNAQLQMSTQRMNEMVHEAAQAGAEMEQGFKKKIFDASQVVNGFTQKIIEQKAVVKDVQANVRKLGEAYRIALKRNPYGADAKLADYRTAKGKLEEERASLFFLTQEQAKARLSVKQLRDEYALYRDDSKKTAVATEGIGLSLKKAFAAIGGAALGKQLISDMIRVRGEFQAADTAIQTLLGSKEKANALMSQVRDYAKISPLEFSDITAATQMMLGFNIEAEKVPKFLAAIGDVSMGETQKFNSLTLAFSQMSAAGKLMGQDLNQMINAGFNPLQQMAQTTGKSIAQLKEEMSKGAISAEMVQQAFIDATSAGGKFYNMSENASKTINGQLSMMQDAIDSTLNELGTKSENAIVGSIQTVTKLIENYETVGKVLAGLVTTYGAYRTALFLSTAAENGHSIAMTLARAQILLTQKAQLALNAAMNANPYAMAAIALGTLVTTLVAFTENTDYVAEAQKRLDDATSNMRKEIASEQADIEILFDDLKNAKKGTEEYNQAKDAILNKYGQYLNGLKEEIRTLNNVKGAYDAITAAATKAARARGMETAMRGAQDAYSSLYAGSSGKLYDKLVEKVGETKATSLLKRLQGEISKTGKASQKLREDIGKIFRGTSAYGNSRAWITGMENATKTLKNETNKIKTIFGDIEERKENKKEKTTTYQEDLSRAKNEWNSAKKELDKIEKDKDKFTSKQYEDAKKRKDAAEKAYRDLGGDIKITSGVGKGDSKTNDAAKRLDAERRANDATLNLQRENQEKELALGEETTEKKIKQINLSYDKQIDTITKKQRELAEHNKKAGTRGLNANGLTDKQQTEIDKATNLAGKERDLQKTDIYRDEMQAMRDYLKEYGTYQQKKLAIAEEYAEKIHKAQSEGEKLTLEKQQQAAIQKVEIEALKQDIDWKGLLGDFGGLFEEQLKPTLEKLKEYTKSDEFKQADINDQKTVYDLITQLQAKTSEGWSGMFRDLGTAVQKVKDAELKQEAAKQKSIQAEKEYEEAKKRNTVKGENGDYVDKTNGEVDAAFQKAQEASGDLAESQANLTNAQNDASDAAKRVRNNMDNLVSGLKGLGSGSMSGILQGINDIAKIFGNDNFSKTIATGLSKTVGGAVGTALAGPLGGEIIEGVFALLDIFKNGIESLFSSLIDTILGAVDGLLGSLLSLDIPLAIGESLMKGLGSITNTITFGGFNSWFGIGGNAKEVAETINRLTDRNETLTTAIESLTDEIKSSKGTKSVAAYRDAYKYQQEANANYLQMAQAQAGYNGSHHSWNYYWGGFSQEQISKLSSQIGRSWNGDLWNLSPEEMKMLRSNVDMWNKIRSTGKGGYGGRLTEKLDDYIDQAGKLEELTNQLYEGLTGMSFDSMYDSFIDTLMDMDASAEDFADNISEYFMRAMLSNKIGELYADKLEKWWHKFGEAMEDDDLTEEERNALQNEYMQYVDEAMKLRDNLAAATGYDNKGVSSQEATKRGFGSEMTHEDAGELSGRFTAMYESNVRLETGQERQYTAITQLSGDISGMMEQMQGAYNIADETRTILANSYLELQQINENTRAVVKPIKQMQADIAEVKRNTSRL